MKKKFCFVQSDRLVEVEQFQRQTHEVDLLTQRWPKKLQLLSRLIELSGIVFIRILMFLYIYIIRELLILDLQ